MTFYSGIIYIYIYVNSEQTESAMDKLTVRTNVVNGPIDLVWAKR